MAAIRGVHRLETNQWILLVGAGFGPDSLQELCSNSAHRLTYFLPTFCLTSPTLLPVFCSRI